MYLKSIELTGFKSFADKTKLQFGPAMTAIVGPNGCGKSNICDAIRWVLGEQSTKLLRGSKMEDCIFNGTENRKPVGMAEVNLTLADCEHTLKTEYNEITVTRRVFRSGEGQYFINKAPCRLKDIQRLFMDTGIGTSDASIMAQGQIDLILSYRPEDRRAVFEEASGIMKYKTDKREALRKLEQTETNLLRIADIIKEVKRQIISIQRQAGKARRVRKWKEELKTLDIFISKNRLQASDKENQQLETKKGHQIETVEVFRQDVYKLEQKINSLHHAVSESEQEVIRRTEKGEKLRSELSQTEQSIAINKNRIKELNEFIQRDLKESGTSNKTLAAERERLQQTQEAIENAGSQLAVLEKALSEKTEKIQTHEKLFTKTKVDIQNLHTESMELGDRFAKLQNMHHKMDANDRQSVMQRERYSAEQINFQQTIKLQEKRLLAFSNNLEKLNAEASKCEEKFSSLASEHDKQSDTINTLERKRSGLLAEIAAKEAQAELLEKSTFNNKHLSEIIKQLHDKSNPLQIHQNAFFGFFAEQFKAEPEFEVALKAVLSPLMDALVVSNMTEAVLILQRLEGSTKAPILLIAATTADARENSTSLNYPGSPLLSHIS